MSAREEILAAAQSNGWTVEYTGRVDLQFFKEGRRVRAEFALGSGAVIGGAAWGQFNTARFEHQGKKRQVLDALSERR